MEHGRWLITITSGFETGQLSFNHSPSFLTRDFDEGPGSAECVLGAAGVVSEVGPGRRADDHRVPEAVLLHQTVLVGVQQHRVAVPLHLKKRRRKEAKVNACHFDLST